MSIIFKGGRLTPKKRRDVTTFTSSIKSDRKLLKSVLRINEAHTIMMMEQGIIAWSTGVNLLKALGSLKGGMKLKSELEDVHMNIEEKIIQKTGLEIGGNLHIGKSRNDQVSSAIRMELREALLDLIISVRRLQENLIKAADKHTETIIPGYTHLQPAQPVTFAHYLTSFVDVLERNLQRLEENYQRVNQCPMGAGALATSSFPINRERVSDLLGFNKVLENSIDAVGSRDFILETLSVLTIIAVDLSRLVEDFIVWSSPEFGIIELPDSFSSTSSIMPQKKNPDVLEVIRARMSHILGNFVASVTIMKSLPSTYNLDFQELTPLVWESLKKVRNSLNMLSKLILHLRVGEESFKKPFLKLTATTELVNMLVRKHCVPFRTAHKIVAVLVRHLIEKKISLDDVTPKLFQKIAKDSLELSLNIKKEDIHACLDPVKIIEAYKVKGGPSPIEVKRMISIRKKLLTLSMDRLSETKSKLDKAKDELKSVIKAHSALNMQVMNEGN